MDNSSLKVFGCLAFGSTLVAHRTKFSLPGHMLFSGYPPGIKGYRHYDLSNKEVFISRNVIFHENIFPFKASSSKTPWTHSATLFSPIWEL